MRCAVPRRPRSSWRSPWPSGRSKPAFMSSPATFGLDYRLFRDGARHGGPDARPECSERSGFVGVFEGLIITAVGLYGVTGDQAFAFALTVHLIHFIPGTLWACSSRGAAASIGRTPLGGRHPGSIARARGPKRWPNPCSSHQRGDSFWHFKWKGAVMAASVDSKS